MRSNLFVCIVALLAVLAVCGCQATHSPLGIRSNTKNTGMSIDKNINKIVVLANKSSYRDHVENIFTERLVQKGYDVASRRDLPAVYQEIALQNSGNTAGEAAKYGKILKSDAVLVVELTDISVGKGDKNSQNIHRATISARLVDVETSKINWICSKSYNPTLLEVIFEIPVELLLISNAELDSLSNSIMDDFPAH